MSLCCLRVIFTGIVTTLLDLQGLKIAGSLALLWIAIDLVAPAGHDKESEVEAADNLWRAVRVVAIADLVMSLDNVIAIAGAAKGNWLLIGIGLATSIPLIIAGAAMITALFDRFPVLIQAGAALLGWVAGEMFATDPFLVSLLGETITHQLEYVLAAGGAVLVLAIGSLAEEEARTRPPPREACTGGRCGSRRTVTAMAMGTVTATGMATRKKRSRTNAVIVPRDRLVTRAGENHPLAFDLQLSFREKLERFGIDPVLFREHPRGQGLLVVTVQYRNLCLQDDWS